MGHPHYDGDDNLFGGYNKLYTCKEANNTIKFKTDKRAHNSVYYQY